MIKERQHGLGMFNIMDNILPNGTASLVSVGSSYAGGAGSTYYWADQKEELCVVFCRQLFAGRLDSKSQLERYVYSAIVD